MPCLRGDSRSLSHPTKRDWVTYETMCTAASQRFTRGLWRYDIRRKRTKRAASALRSLQRGILSGRRAERREGEAVNKVMNPSASLLVKLGSLIVHHEEAIS